MDTCPVNLGSDGAEQPVVCVFLTVEFGSFNVSMKMVGVSL